MATANTPFAFAVFALMTVLWSSSGQALADASVTAAGDQTFAEGPSLAELSQVIEAQEFLSGKLFDFGQWTDVASPVEGRGKKPKPGQMAMVMAGSAAASMMMMKAMGAIKLFIIHSFFATKLGLIVGAYLLVCKLMEMKQMPPKKVVKWVSPPSHHDEHPMMAMSYPSVHDPSSGSPPSYDLDQGGAQQHQPSDQYGPPPQQQQQFMPSSDFGGGGGGGDMHAHYSHISPVTYRPMINRNQSDNTKASGRIR